MNEQEQAEPVSMEPEVPESWSQHRTAIRPARRPFRLSPGYGILLALVLAAAFAMWWAGGHSKPTKPPGGFWDYEVKEVTFERRESIEMKLLDEARFEESLKDMGNRGGELVAVIPTPSRVSAEGRVDYQLIFKRRTDQKNYLDEDQGRRDAARDKAIHAEAEAREASFQRRLEAIRGK